MTRSLRKLPGTQFGLLTTNCNLLSVLNCRKLFCIALETGKSKIKTPADGGSGEDWLLSEMPTKTVLGGSLYMDTGLILEDSTLRI